MTKIWVALAAVLMLSGTAMAADDWTGNFEKLDADGNGSISASEWSKSSEVLKDSTFSPAFSAMDADNSNSISKSEWGDAEGLVSGYSERLRECDKSWC